MLRKYFAALAAGLILMPAVASAQIILSQEQKVQLAGLASQLLTIFNGIAAAQAQGATYTSSSAFQAQAATWTGQLVQIQLQLGALLSAAAQAPTVIPTAGGGNACPNLYRTVSLGDQGSDVASLQLFLARDNAARYKDSVNGYYDTATMEAVQRYQAAYGIVLYGDPDTTGYGKVGPATRASIQVACSQGPYITSVPPITIPATTPPPYNPYNPPPPPVSGGYSTGQISLVTTLTGQSGGPNSVTISVNMLPNASCSGASYILTFGDGQQQNLTSSASCGNQIQQIPHVYPNTGQYSATLTSGSFITSLVVNIQAPNNSLMLATAADQNTSFAGTITATYNPGATCAPGAYSVTFGDGNSQNINFNNGCSAQTQVISHTYSQAGQYLVTASDQYGHTVTANFTAVAITSAGAGDPFQVLLVHGDGANGSTTFVDSSVKGHTLTGNGGAHIDTSSVALGTGAIRLSGSAYVSTPSNDDFNYGSGPFTLDLWFKAQSFPNPGNQAVLIGQAGSNASDNSLGGAGLELFGNQLYFFGNIGGFTYHPFYNNAPHSGGLDTGVWHHGAVVRSGNAVTLYLDGTSVGGITVAGSANASTGSLSIGRYGDFSGDYFQGLIDEVDIAKGTARWTANFNPNALTGSCPDTSGRTPTVSGGKSVFINASDTCVPAQTSQVTITWTTSGVSACTLSWSFADGSTGGSNSVSPNGSGSTGIGSVDKTYTISCDGVSSSVTIYVE